MSSLIVSQGLAQTGRGGGPRFDFRKKAESKENKRWTLGEWLEQKDRSYLMDLWLGMYAPSPYEFFLSGSYLTYDQMVSLTPAATPDAKYSHKSYSGSIGAFALVMGLVAEYENNTEEGYNDLLGSLNVRVLGNAVQGTHLILSYGLRTRNIDNSVSQVRLNQQFGGADLDLYMTRFFGLHGNYRAFLPYTETTLGEIKGSKTEAGGYIDFGPVRIFGNWFNEKQDSVLSGTTTHTENTGVQSGLKFFF
jgi:hypothetical protein